MRMEAAYTALNDSRRGILAAPALNDNRTLAAMGRRHLSPRGSIYGATPARGLLRRLVLGAGAAVFALFLLPVLPSMVDQEAVQLGVAQPLHVIGQSAAASQAAPAAVAPASPAQDDASRAPAAFSDALAAAPAQCDVKAHSCSVASDDGSSRTVLAYRAAQSQRAGQHHERL